MTEMIEDRSQNGVVVVNANAPLLPAIAVGTESTIEAVTAFGRTRAVQRAFRIESAEAAGTARQLQYSHEECQYLSDQLRQMYEHGLARDAWWRNGVESMMMEHSERGQEKEALLEASQEGWTMKCAELQGIATAGTQRMYDQHQFTEALTTRLRATESMANDEFGRLKTDADKAQHEILDVRNQLLRAEAAEQATKQLAQNAIAEQKMPSRIINTSGL